MREIFRKRCILICLILLAVAFPPYMQANDNKAKPATAGKAVIWQDPGDIRARDLFHGPHGVGQLPQGPFKFIDFAGKGTQAQMIIEDGQGKRWRAKVGDEARAETVAARLLWAVGYFADETHFITSMKVEGLDADDQVKLPVDGIVEGYLHAVRLEPELEAAQFTKWSWFNNPLEGTREFDGLRVMMALINNWDLKRSNNRIDYDEATGEARYLVHDIGASFGRTGAAGKRSKSNAKHYAKAKFIDESDGEKVDLVMKSRPNMLLVFMPGYYTGRARMEKVAKEIPIEHAKWIGQLLGQLSEDQIRDAFRAAHYESEEIDLFAKALHDRIADLNKL